jgi:hypothetical protein
MDEKEKDGPKVINHKFFETAYGQAWTLRSYQEVREMT